MDTLQTISPEPQPQNGNSLLFSLEQIARWKNNHVVDIPSLQRGLVWSPRQVELFWDSVFRGFPVGSFAITPVGNAPNQKHDSSNSEYFLLDGQQRYNAIVLGYNREDDPKAVLWLDLFPQNIDKNSTRIFWFKVTTKAHPWGFANNDNCSLLGWKRYREAIQKFRNLDNEDDLSNTKVLKSLNLNNTWPIEAGCPIMLSSVFNCYDEASKTEKPEFVFEQGIRDCLKNTGHDYKIDELNATFIPRLYSAIRRLKKYRIVAKILSD